jgi:hypothetical protein
MMEKNTMKILKAAALAVIAGCVLIIGAVSYHSVREIHYLKSFYPARFTVAEAASATEVELIKVALTSFPIVLIAIICAWIVTRRGNEVSETVKGRENQNT